MRVFFFASAGASAAYLTVSEVFPMETRALCIAFFYAIGTAVGGIAGPLLSPSWSRRTAGGHHAIALGYSIGAALMIAGGLVEVFLGVKAEGQSLEDIAEPLTAEDDADSGTGSQPSPPDEPDRPHHIKETHVTERHRQKSVGRKVIGS